MACPIVVSASAEDTGSANDARTASSATHPTRRREGIPLPHTPSHGLFSGIMASVAPPVGSQLGQPRIRVHCVTGSRHALAEAQLLSRMDPLLPIPRANRVRVPSDRGPTGRGVELTPARGAAQSEIEAGRRPGLRCGIRAAARAGNAPGVGSVPPGAVRTILPVTRRRIIRGNYGLLHKFVQICSIRP